MDEKTNSERRTFIHGAGAAATVGAVSVSIPRWGWTSSRLPTEELTAVRSEITKRHQESLERLQTWIRQPSIAAENRGMAEGCQLMMEMLKEAGFANITKVPTDGQPGVYATLDAGAPKTMGIYYMYDVKQADPKEWSSPPFEAALVDKPDLGKVVMGRGAVNQKGPEATFLAAIHAIRGAGKKLPVNLVFVAEGEEEIGSPHFPQVLRKPEIQSAFSKSVGVFMPFASQDVDGQVTVFYGAKGVVELELVSSGEKWGRGPHHDVHSSNKARLDSPAWHLIEALASLVSTDGNEIAIENYAAKAKSLSAAEKKMIADAAKRLDEASAKKQLGVSRWMHDANWEQALEMLVSRPTINIEGLVGGYTGPGGKTILPGRAVAKLDLRLVPDMTKEAAVTALTKHLAKHGFGDIEVNVTGGYDPTSTAMDAAICQAEGAVYKSDGIDPVALPRLAGSWPGFVFTGDPLDLPAGHFGLGHGSGAHAPDEYYLIESTQPKLRGLDGATLSYVEYLYQIAAST